MDMDSTLVITIVYFVGIIFVIISAVRFFNDPPMEPYDIEIKNILHSEPAIEPVIPKYVTERTRYYLYLGAFICITLALYFFVSLIFPLVVAKMFGGDLQFGYSVALVIGTLAFINFSKKLPFVYETLKNWKNDLHKRARIPDNALYVFDCLNKNEANKSTEAFKRILGEILDSKINGQPRTDIEKDDFYFEKNRIERKWARLTYLIHCLDKWENEKQFSRHLKTESLRWLALNAYYKDTLFPAMVKFKNAELDETAKELLKNTVSATLIKVYWLITLLLFMANRSTEDPCVHLKSIGWVVSTNSYFKFSYRHIFFTGSIVFCAILLGAALGSWINFLLKDVLPDTYSISPDDVRQWSIYGSLMFITPLFVTLSLKRFLTMHNMWAIRRPEDPVETFLQRPWEVYFPVSIISYATTVLILGTFVSFFGDREPLEVFNRLSVYCILSFISSMFVCYLIDTPSPGWEKDPKYYIKSLPVGMLLGILNVILLTYAALLFSDLNNFDIRQLTDETKGKLVVQCITVFIIGIVIYMTSKVGSKHYERRDSTEQRSTDGWWTVTIDNFHKRVQANRYSAKNYEILADEELQAVADVGDKVQMTNVKENLFVEVKEVVDDKIRVAITA